MHGAPFGEIARQGTPGTAGTLHIEDGAKDIVQVHFARCCAFTGTFQEREKGQIVCDLCRLGRFFRSCRQFTAETMNTFLERVHSLRSRTPKNAKTTICRLVLNLRLPVFHKCLTRVTTVSKEFLYRPKIILVTFQG